MPRRQTKREVPRWRRGKQQTSYAGVQLTGRDARKFTRELARLTATQSNPAAAKNDVLAKTGAWRFRRHLAPFIWLAVLAAAAVALRRSAHPLIFANIAAWATGLLVVWATRHLSPFARRATDAAALASTVWLPVLTSVGLAKPFPALLAITWAVFAVVWIHHYGWRPKQATAPPAADTTSDEARWKALAGHQKWSGTLGQVEQLAGGGRRYPLQLDGVKTTIGPVLSAAENVAGAWHKPMTEAYVERDPRGVTSRGYLTIIGSESLMKGREWNGQGMNEIGQAMIGRYADGSSTHIKLYTPKYGTRHGLLSGTTGSGKSEMLNLLIFIAIMSGCFVLVVLDPQEGQSLPFWRDRCLYAAGVDECHRMLRGLHAGMLDRSRYLSGFRWEDDGITMRGLPFFDSDLTGLKMPLIFFDEAHMARG